MSVRGQSETGSPVSVLITIVCVAASVVVALTGRGAFDVIAARPFDAAAFALLTLGLQLLAVPIYGRGSISVAAVGLLATGFSLGTGVAIALAILVAAVQFVRSRGLLHRAIFDAANFTLATGAAALAYETARLTSDATIIRVAAAIAACVTYFVVNTGLLALAMSLAEDKQFYVVWRERFRWVTGHFLAFGPLALASVVAYENVGLAGLLAFALPPALLILSVRQYLERTRESVAAVENANEELRLTNEELASRNADLRDLFDFTGGLAPRVHDRGQLVAYAEQWISGLTGAPARIRIGRGSGGIPLTSGGEQVGTLSLIREGRFDEARWERLRDAIIPQLATAIESTELVEKVRKTYVATIAALSRSMEAKDIYTSGHTERVATIAVEIARRLGYSGADLDAIETGALLHDIGKIGVPERVLHKQGPLDESEWELMRKHPVISDYILSEIDLPAIVHQIARSSHERVDGAGYPDRLRGTEIPLPARIIHVADAWDSLTSDRPYRSARTAEQALEEIRANTGTQFCPIVVGAFEQLCRDDLHVLMRGRLSAVA
jgi:putative nucleotidyltransferase with HDIG domain